MDQDQLLIVTSPSKLPTARHDEAIDYFCRQFSFVILLEFGDDIFDLPEGYTLPLNARIINYDYESMGASADTLASYLSPFGVQILNKRKNDHDPLPFILTGSIVVVPEDVSLQFYNSATTSIPDPEKPLVSRPGEWDII